MSVGAFVLQPQGALSVRAIVKAQDHTASYYAATANDATRYPALEGTVKADVCVIGGGFSGVATALTMAERGRSVVLLEANRIGWGASGRNGGQMIAGISGEARDQAPARRGRRQARARHSLPRPRDHRGPHRQIRHLLRSEARLDGGCSPPEPYEGHPRQRRRAHQGWRRRSPRNRRAAGNAARAWHDRLSWRHSSIAAVATCTGSICASAKPRAAANLGVRIFEQTRAVALEGGAKPWVKTERGRVEADTVIIGGEIFDNFDQPRLKGLMLPTGSYIIATEPLSEAVAAAINPQDLAVADSNVVLDYFRLSADRRMLFGGRCNYSNRDPTDIGASLRPRMIEIFPQLADAKIDYRLGRSDRNHRRPRARHRTTGAEPLLSCRATAATASTPRISPLKSSRTQSAELRSGSIYSTAFVTCGCRSATGSAIEMLALGMLYYRLRDLL